MNKHKAQSILEYFLLLGVLVVIAVLGSGAFRTKIQGKLLQYRNVTANRIIGR